MVSLQLISKILKSKDFSVYEDNMLTSEYFVGYEEEIQYIVDHKEKYGNVPDEETFLHHFIDAEGKKDIQLVECSESDKYLVDTLREEYLYYKYTKIMPKLSDLLQSDSNAATEYLMSQITTLQPTYSIGYVDIVSQADVRLNEYKEKKDNQDNWFLESGFKELDDITHGLKRGEELVVIVARTNQGKSWILEKMCTHVWQTGFNVGYVSPEMSASSIGFRFDTLYNNFSNKDLMWGKEGVDSEQYESYISKLKEHKNKFIVSTPLDFDRKITVTKLRNYIKQNKLDMLAIDGITYISDERGSRNDNKTTSLTNISEDLMAMSVELKVPILVVVQANRNGASENDSTPELEHIRDSDGISFNASQVLSIRQKQNNVLEIGIKKQRNGSVGGKLTYSWDINTGSFEFCPNYEDSQPREKSDKQIKESRNKFKEKDAKDIF